MVSEEAAYALVSDVTLLLAARGHSPVITDANAPWLVRSGVMMLAAFGIGTAQATEIRDEALHQDPR